MFRTALILFSVATTTMGCLAVADEVSGSIDRENQLEQWIEDLTDDSFVTRKRATHQLVRLCRESEPARQNVEERLRIAIRYRSSTNTIRLQEFLLRLCDEPRWHQLDRLTNLNVTPGEIQVAGWKEFSSIIGSDWDARSFYRDIYIRFGQQIENRFGQEHAQSTQIQSTQIPPINLLRIRSDDEVSWAFLLFCDQAGKSASHSPMTWELASRLRNTGHGPSQKTPNAHLIKRLIGQWVWRHRFNSLPDDLIFIANRYECDEIAKRLCHWTLSHQMMPPATHATAILTLWMIETRELRSLDRLATEKSVLSAVLERYADDSRVCFRQCNVTPSRKTETQLRDITLAVKLYRQGIDPRDVGFDGLQADAFTIIRADSLGFENSKSRQRAFLAAETLLQSE